MPEMRDVYSTSVNSVGYDEEAGSLYVTWENGRTSVYSGVPPDVARKAENAWSVGKFIREEVVGRYGHKYV